MVCTRPEICFADRNQWECTENSTESLWTFRKRVSFKFWQPNLWVLSSAKHLATKYVH